MTEPTSPRLRRHARPVAGPAARVWVVSAAMALAALTVLHGTLRDTPALDTPLTLPWWLLVALFAATEVFVIHVEVRREAHTLSLSEIPLVLGLAFADPVMLLVTRLAGSGFSLVVHRRQEPMKLAFNLALFAMETTVAVAVYRAVLGVNDPNGPWGWGAAFAAAPAVQLLGAFVVTAAISLHEGRLQRELLPSALTAGLVNATTNTSVALLAVTVLWADPRAAVLLVVMATILFGLYRAHSGLRQRYASLGALYAFTRRVGRSLDVEAVIAAILSEARDLLQAGRAELTLHLPDDPLGTRRWVLGPDGEVVTRRPEPGVLRMGERVARAGEAVLLAPGERPGEGDDLARLHARDAIVAAVQVDGTVVGTMVVADRLGNVRSFDREDVKLFETLVNHASVTLENSYLVERLRGEAAAKEHQANHDALTGLPNRSHFRRRVEEALFDARRSPANVAVLLMDLDRFKEVNDTLGHHNGDLLLQEVSARLAVLLRGGEVVARLGGDEFAILLPRTSGTADAVRAAEKILRSLQEPFVHRDLVLEVGASIGIAMSPDHGTEAATLLQRADVAMYAAKAAQCGFEIYAADRDQYSPRRLALVGELRAAIEQSELEVHYQPTADLRTGRVIGVEALVRWNHPRHGYLPPDEFIPVAEHTGLIRPLTRHVLRTALRQVRDWRDQGISLRVAVNLSARSVLDVRLPEEIAGLLAEFETPRGGLTLEITESMLMIDSPRTVGVLARLHDLGVDLAIDDFGTGYSSLSYLKRLPVDEIKIDRSFVMNMPASDSDAKIVRSTVNLARDLGMRVVAEGVETREVWDRLADFGCDLAQGYFLTKPVPPAQLERWLRSTWERSERAGADVVPITRSG